MAYDNGMRGKDDREIIEETLGRARRLETKVSVIAEHLGVDVGGKRPVFEASDNTMQVPTRKTSLDDILAAIPDDHAFGVAVYCGEDFLASVLKQ